MNYEVFGHYKRDIGQEFGTKIYICKVPPNKLQMYANSDRRELTTGIVGPLEEGSDLILRCEVRGGKPPPTVSWFINDRLVEGELDSINHYMVNKLTVRHLTREQLNSTFKCQASNTKLMTPVEKSVQLELQLKPLSVKILNKPMEMISDQDYLIKCEVTGSRPRANITWLRDKREFRRGSVSIVSLGVFRVIYARVVITI
ncbi:hypothetical protein QE152_g21508 [Popillia japonica]|uniref:Ig-like domain-containing protein n=1 Tax=Popillia japonica TaxID=7064 RepID=A0AAW1KNR5_POPJA